MCHRRGKEATGATPTRHSPQNTHVESATHTCAPDRTLRIGGRSASARLFSPVLTLHHPLPPACASSTTLSRRSSLLPPPHPLSFHLFLVRRASPFLSLSLSLVGHSRRRTHREGDALYLTLSLSRARPHTLERAGEQRNGSAERACAGERGVGRGRGGEGGTKEGDSVHG